MIGVDYCAKLLQAIQQSIKSMLALLEIQHGLWEE